MFWGNLIWLLCGGLLSGASWALAGCLWCVTVVGIPVGLQCFKFAALGLCPFGKEIVRHGGAVALVPNFLWLIFSGLPLALEHAAMGLVLCATIIGIPFGKQHFKIARLALAPFGSAVV